MEIRIFNETLLKKYNLIDNVTELSSPLLVSSDSDYINNVKNSNNKILYVGQETNGWVNDNINEGINQDLLESIYLEVLQRKNSNEFFKFLSNLSSDCYKNVIWANTLIAGKRYGIGHPNVTDKLQELSLENLLFLYKYFKPDITLFVSGPCNPYYEIVKSFLNIIHSKIDDYPTIYNPLITDKENNIHWTYHPNYLNRVHLKQKVLDGITKQ